MDGEEEEILMVIRRMTEADLPLVAELEKLCFSEYWSYGTLEAGLYSPFDVYFVLAQGGNVVGYANLRILAGEGEIQRIAVLPEFRRQGEGRKLMDAMVSYARENQVYAITLEVRAGNRAARNLYESYGFAGEALRKGYYRNPPEDAVIMWLRQV